MNEMQKTINFYGQELVMLDADGEARVAMRPIVDGIGLAWEVQNRKLLEQKAKFNCDHMVSVAADGKMRSMLCMPLKKLPLWLASINPAKISNPEVKAKVELYQEECADALYKYWFEGAAIRKDAQFTRSDALALARRVIAQAEREEKLEGHIRIFGNRTPYGAISERNGLPRVKPRRATLCADRRSFIIPDGYQAILLAPVECEVVEG